MKLIVFGASGMIGSGVLIEAFDDPRVTKVISVGRSPSGHSDAKLVDVVVKDLFSLEADRDQLGDFDACIYCLGASSTGMSEEHYRRLTLDLTNVVADVLESINPSSTFCFVSGQGSGGRAMWAQVKGEAEQAVLARGLHGYAFRPGIIQPVRGVVSRTRLYRMAYAVLGPLIRLLRRLAPGSITTSEVLGRALINVAADGFDKRILETPDINRAGASHRR